MGGGEVVSRGGERGEEVGMMWEWCKDGGRRSSGMRVGGGGGGDKDDVEDGAVRGKGSNVLFCGFDTVGKASFGLSFTEMKPVEVDIQRFVIENPSLRLLNTLALVET